MPPIDTAAPAVRASRRRKFTFFYNVGAGATVAALLLYLLVSRSSSGSAAASVVKETFRLQCLSPEQALEVLRPYVGRAGLIAARPSSPLGLIHVEAPPDMMARVRLIIDKYDNPSQSQCAVQVTVPKTP